MDKQLIEEVATFRDDVLSKISNRDIITFKLGDLSFDENINVHGNIITESAINRILTTLKVQKGFLEYKEKMPKEQWDQVKTSLQEANKSTEYWGKKVVDTKGVSKIVKLFQKNELARESNLSVGFKDYFDMITKALEGTNIEFDLKTTYFDEDKEKVVLRFLNKNSTISVFKEVVDNWKTGVDLTFDLLQYHSAPFFERQVCTNGMTALDYGFQTNIKNQSFKSEDLQKEINRLLIKGDSKLEQLLIDAVNHLNSTDISVREFYLYRDFFVQKNQNGIYDSIIAKFFSDTPLFKAYGVDPNKQSERWRSSATSGRNGYDFLNDITWLASHTDESRIDQDDALELQIKMANLIFKPTLDLEDIAPKVDLKLGKFIQNNN